MAKRDAYCVIADLRAEGIGSQQLNDTRAQELIDLACDYIDKLTGLWFSSFTTTLLIDGEGYSLLHMPVPIVEITSITDADYGALALGEVTVYNRVVPDDRANPRLHWGYGIFSAGHQNIEVVGKFGYVDYDSSGVAITPPDIQRAAIMLVAREIPLLGSEERKSAVGPMKSESIDRYSYTLADLMVNGEMTGSVDIDKILSRYMFGTIKAFYP